MANHAGRLDGRPGVAERVGGEELGAATIEPGGGHDPPARVHRERRDRTGRLEPALGEQDLGAARRDRLPVGRVGDAGRRHHVRAVARQRRQTDRAER